jgi:hypothetical protein
MPAPETWEEYRRLVMDTLDRIGRDISNINEKIERFRQEDLLQIRTDIALLKFQAALWGAGAGIIITLATTLLPRLLK